MLKMDTYLRWISAIHNIYMTLTATTHSLEIGRDMYSHAQLPVFRQTAPQRKLTPNFKDKIRYVVQYRNLNCVL